MAIFILCGIEATKTRLIRAVAVNPLVDIVSFYGMILFCRKLFNRFITRTTNLSTDTLHMYVHLGTTALRLIHFDVYASFMLPSG